MAGLTTSEICENTKLAREMAVMGNYDSAGIYYEGVLQMLRKLLMGISEPIRKGKWTMVGTQYVPNLCGFINFFLFRRRSSKKLTRSTPR